jgi:hypothetical protein
MSTDENNSSGGKTAGISVGVILLFVLSRGFSAYSRMKPEFDRMAKQNAAEADREKRFSDEAKQGMDRYFENQKIYTQVKALQDEFKLSDIDFETMLRDEWKAVHPDSGLEPWRVRIGNAGPYWWRENQRWDIESIRRRCATASSPETAIAEDKTSP